MSAQPILSVPPLQPGDHLTVREFMRRYEAMPEDVSAELIEGVVFMASPVRASFHGKPHARITTWLGVFEAETVGVETGVGATLLLKAGTNVAQPDAYLRILPEYGGQSETDAKDYLTGVPEMVAEIAASTASYDLHEKLRVYERNHIQEYLIWRVLEKSVDWFALRDGRFKRISQARDGHLKSRCFPGLWLNPSALLKGDLAQVLRVLEKGLASPEHKRFVERLTKAKARRNA